MYFNTTGHHEAFRTIVRNFAETEIKPIAAALDRENRFLDEVVAKMGRLGIMGTPFPEEYGGGGLDTISYAIAVEELSRVDGGIGVILSAHTSLGSYPIMAYGTQAQKEKYLIPMAKGEKLGAFGLAESGARSDAGGIGTTAELEGDHYILNGCKVFVSNAPKASIYIIFAVTTPGIGKRGISAFIVEDGWEGFSYGKLYDKLGTRSSSTAELIFDNLKVPKENLLGKEGQGYKIAKDSLRGGRISAAAQALGIAQGAYDSALDFAKGREQSGKPIAFRHSVSFKLADMATKLRACRMLVYGAADLMTNHEPYAAESAMAKYFTFDRCLEIVDDALSILDGSGFMKDSDAERFFRDARSCTTREGTDEIQRVIVATSRVDKKPKARDSASRKEPAVGERKKIVWKGGAAANKTGKCTFAPDQE